MGVGIGGRKEKERAEGMVELSRLGIVRFSVVSLRKNQTSHACLRFSFRKKELQDFLCFIEI